MNPDHTIFLQAGRAARRGLTLIEIMVVIALLGVIGTVVVVNVAGTFQEGSAKAAAIQMKEIDKVLLTNAMMNKGKYPTTSEGLDKIKSKFTNSKVPTDPWGNAYIYRSPATHGSGKYELISLGADGKEGGDGPDSDLKSWELE